jgi:general secretion pathway protein G
MDTHIEEKKDKGFTLVELLIVIVILGILATVTVFAVRGITDKGQDSACAADQKTLETAVESYFAQNAGATIPADTTAAEDVTWTSAAPSFNDQVQATLVTAGLMRSQSHNFDVDTNGGVTGVNDCA